MLIPLIPKDLTASDFTCRDGEVEALAYRRRPEGLLSMASLSMALLSMGTYPTATIRIPLQNGDKDKANLLLSGEITRVDPATAERLTQAIVQKGAECLLDLSTDFRRRGLFILPFRFYTMTMMPDGSLSYPSPQAVALPSDFPPHPEITAAAATDDALTLAIRFPVRPHRLILTTSEGLSMGDSLRTFISYPLYIPDPKEMRGSIGSVRSATGGNATGIRFAFLSTSAIKASVAAPEKYYELVGNERTGYRMASKAAATPDYSCYAEGFGYVAPFPKETMLAIGDEVDAATDPMDWIADWQEAGDGYLPVSLPRKFRDANTSEDENSWPEGLDSDEILATAESLGMPYVLLTRPMALSSDNRSRRNAEPRAIRSIRVHGLGDEEAQAILYGSHDCRHWTEMRRFDPHRLTLLLTPCRFWWRLLLYGKQPFNTSQLCLNINLLQ